MRVGSIKRDPWIAVVSVRIVGPTGIGREIAAVVDTGCSSDGLISEELAAELKLASAGEVQSELADGSFRLGSVYPAVVEIGSEVTKIVRLNGCGNTLVLGLPFFRGRRLMFDVQPEGDVAIRKLSEIA